MAIVTVISATKNAVSGATTQFTTTSPFVLYGDDLGWDTPVRLLRLGPSGGYRDATNEKGVIEVKDYPNMVYIDTPGTFQLIKPLTPIAASVGYEELP